MGRPRAMMNHPGFTMAKRQQLCTLLDTIVVQDSAKYPLLLNCFGVDTNYANI